jgi:hypothetical protein
VAGASARFVQEQKRLALNIRASILNGTSSVWGLGAQDSVITVVPRFDEGILFMYQLLDPLFRDMPERVSHDTARTMGAGE